MRKINIFIIPVIIIFLFCAGANATNRMKDDKTLPINKQSPPEQQQNQNDQTYKVISLNLQYITILIAILVFVLTAISAKFKMEKKVQEDFKDFKNEIKEKIDKDMSVSVYASIQSIKHELNNHQLKAGGLNLCAESTDTGHRPVGQSSTFIFASGLGSKW